MEDFTFSDLITQFVVPALGALFVFLIVNHYALKERVKVLEIELAQNKAMDERTTANYEKLWDAIQTMSQTLTRIESEVKQLMDAR